MPSRIIIIQGGPATGKTTLANKLRPAVELGLVAKDDVKEFLFDHMGLPEDKVESRIYGIATMNAQFAVARVFATSGKSFILEGAFHPIVTALELERLLEVSGVQIMQIYCTAEQAVQTARFNERLTAERRHEGHREVIRSEGEDFVDSFGQLDIDHTLRYDTTTSDESTYNEIVDAVKHFLEDR